MKVAELFAELGFKVTGGAQLTNVNTGMATADVSAKKLAIRMGVLSAALIAIIDISARAGTALRNFALSTDLSTDDLQEWQQAAVANGLAAETLTSSIKALQQARASFALGDPQAMGAWSMLGVDPRQDPFKVLTSLRKRASSFKDTGVFSNLLGQVGLQSLLPLLRSTNVEFEKWSKIFLVTKAQQAQLTHLNATWQTLKLSISNVKTQFVAVLAPALTMILKGFQWLAEKVGVFVHWLEQSTPAATFLRTTLQVLVPLIIALGAAMAAAFALGPIVGFLSPLAQALAIASAFLLVLDDIITGLAGGQSLTRSWGEAIGEWLSKFEAVDRVMQSIERLIGKTNREFEKVNFFSATNVAKRNAEAAVNHGASGSWAVNNDVKISVTGTQDPQSTARETKRLFDQQVRLSTSQAGGTGQ